MNEQSPSDFVVSLADYATIAVVLLIIAGAGVFGGWAAYLASKQESEEKDAAKARASRARFLFLGVLAAACVPLFLSLVQSNLVQAIFRADRGQPFEQYLVFLGLCLLAAFSARAFIESVSRRVLRDLEDVKEKQQNIQQQVQQTAELVDEQNAEPIEQRSQVGLESLDSGAVPAIAEEERRTLNAMMKVSFRTATGIANDVGIPRSRIGDILDSLANKQLIERTVSPNTGGPRWKISALGVAALNRPEGA